jgi:hypothetical protein
MFEYLIAATSLQATSHILDKHIAAYQSLRTMSLCHNNVDILSPVLYLSLSDRHFQPPLVIQDLI